MSCLGQVGMALHHKICHTLGGLCDLPHAEPHSITLPHAMAYNHVATDAMPRIARALGVVGNPAVAMHQLARRLGAPMSLRVLGMPDAPIRQATSLASPTPTPHPPPLHTGAIQAIFYSPRT